MTRVGKAANDADPNCMLKSRFWASRLFDIILGLKKPRRDLIIAREWGVLLDIQAFSAPKGLLEWIVLKIDPELGEFRNTRNNTHIVFNKEMIVTALGLPRGTRPVLLIGDHEESPYRDFYRIKYTTAGWRAPIHRAEKILEDDTLDDETWFRTFYLVVLPSLTSILILWWKMLPAPSQRSKKHRLQSVLLLKHQLLMVTHWLLQPSKFHSNHHLPMVAHLHNQAYVRIR